ncbi:hypothetical protein [Flectobacillus rivi]|uniref:Uncharacterized protein n=1 Tax=Flectobacillus rivi TaxID=2984209 RepID=A0ABT6Z1K6_9BACT|nr:hypothetical protein [Flectobacillus rivi]MDI9874982.1 hypothetical protein [Flectobacillus rivi]
MVFAKQYQNQDTVASVNYNDGVARTIKIVRKNGLYVALLFASNLANKLVPVGREYFTHSTIVSKVTYLNGFTSGDLTKLASDSELIAVGLKATATAMEYTQFNSTEFDATGYIEPQAQLQDTTLIRMIAYAKKLVNILEDNNIDVPAL